MRHRFQHRLFTDYWSALRFPSTRWVSAMLAGQLARTARRAPSTPHRPPRATFANDACDPAEVPCRPERLGDGVCCAPAG